MSWLAEGVADSLERCLKLWKEWVKVQSLLRYVSSFCKNTVKMRVWTHLGTCMCVCVFSWFGLFFVSVLQSSTPIAQSKLNIGEESVSCLSQSSSRKYKENEYVFLPWNDFLEFGQWGIGSPYGLELWLCLLCFIHIDLSCKRGKLTIQQSLEVFMIVMFPA